jgi:peptidoglycan hydrolase CwlO-like protein
LPSIANNDKKIIEQINELVPSTITQQQDIIVGNRGNLFGLQDKTVDELERVLTTETNEQNAPTGENEQSETTETTEIENEVQLEGKIIENASPI